jgi:hypothetical protein
MLMNACPTSCAVSPAAASTVNRSSSSTSRISTRTATAQ